MRIRAYPWLQEYLHGVCRTPVLGFVRVLQDSRYMYIALDVGCRIIFTYSGGGNCWGKKVRE